jgi:hypothetical protein
LKKTTATAIPEIDTTLVIGYLAATAISSLHDALQAILIEYTDGYQRTPRNRAKRAVLEDGCAAALAYRSIIGREIDRRTHRLSGHSE